METKTKVWLIIAVSLVLTGCYLFTGVMSKLNWDFTKLSTFKYETNVYEISESFEHISINTNTAEIIFTVSDSENLKVECYEAEMLKHSVTVEENTLVINTIDNRAWYDYIGISLGSPKITISLPTTEYRSLFINEHTGDIEIPDSFTFTDADITASTGDVNFNTSASETVKIKTSTGDIHLENISAGTLDLSVYTGKVTVSGVTCEGDITVNVSTGKASLTDIECKNIISSGSTGDISLENVIAKEKFSIKRSTGNIKLVRADAAEIFIKTDTGSVRGSILTDKVFITQTDTGNISVPKTANGGKCEVITDTGDIKITIE